MTNEQQEIVWSPDTIQSIAAGLRKVSEGLVAVSGLFAVAAEVVEDFAEEVREQ